MPSDRVSDVHFVNNFLCCSVIACQETRKLRNQIENYSLEFESQHRSVGKLTPSPVRHSTGLVHTSTGKRQNTVRKINLRGEIGTLKHVHY